jgi:gluconokinase
MQSYILGTDIGTGSTKTVAADFSGKVLCSSQNYHSTLSPEPGYSEQDPVSIFNAFIESIHEAVLKVGNPPAAISLSSAMHGLIAVDESGHPLSNLILWSDSRSSSIADEIKNSPQGKSIYEATGTPIHSMSPLCKIIWLQKNKPELFQKTYKFISIKEYIWHRLFGEFKIDHSLASATGLFHIEELAWNSESLSLAAITKEHLSQPVSTSYIKAGLPEQIAALLHVPASTPFCIGASDGCLANLGTNAMEPGVAAITIGTSGAVRVARKKPSRDFSAMSFNYILDEQTFICGGPTNNGGSVVEWLLRNFLSHQTVQEKEYTELFTRIEQIPAGCEGLIFLPYLNGERAPLWDEEACGVFFGVKSHHHQAHFLRAALEAICFSLKDILSSVEDSSNPIYQINASGGFVHSQVWMQLLADISGKQVSVQQTKDASAIGAAYLALKALNIIVDYSTLQKGTKILHPHEEVTEVYKKTYAVFKTLYPGLKASMHLL